MEDTSSDKSAQKQQKMGTTGSLGSFRDCPSAKGVRKTKAPASSLQSPHCLSLSEDKKAVSQEVRPLAAQIIK